jgi:hypothetical protein
MGAENLAFTGIRFPNRPACSESLYRLSYFIFKTKVSAAWNQNYTQAPLVPKQGLAFSTLMQTDDRTYLQIRTRSLQHTALAIFQHTGSGSHGSKLQSSKELRDRLTHLVAVVLGQGWRTTGTDAKSVTNWTWQSALLRPH